MLRGLFDKNGPYPLKRHPIDYQVQAADDEDWGQISNGELIECAERAGYHILLTCDQNVRYQRNLTHRKISIVVLGSNLTQHQPKITAIAAALKRVSPGSFEFIGIAPPPKRRRLTGLSM